MLSRSSIARSAPYFFFVCLMQACRLSNRQTRRRRINTNEKMSKKRPLRQTFRRCSWQLRVCLAREARKGKGAQPSNKHSFCLPPSAILFPVLPSRPSSYRHRSRRSPEGGTKRETSSPAALSWLLRDAVRLLLGALFPRSAGS